MNKSLLATTAVALALLGGTALANEARTDAKAQAPGVTVAATSAVSADKIIGKSVVNAANDKIGEVESILTDKNGNARFAILGVGGFLGIGERTVAVPYRQLQISGNADRIVLNSSKDQLAAMPAYRYTDPKRRGQAYNVDDEVKTNPYLTQASASVDVEKLIGRDIKNAKDETVGEIDSVMIDADGKARYVVANVGGFLGMGEKHVALAWDGLTISENGERVTANVEKDALKELPEFKYADNRRGVFSVDEGMRNNPLLTQRPVAGDAAPVAGANSFTEEQAKARIEAQGYTNVSNLTKDAESIWRGSATKDGKSVRVAVDFKGNVVAN